MADPPARLPHERMSRGGMNALVRKSRVANFVLDLAQGMTQRAVAEKYGVSARTVRAELAWAHREGFFEKAEDALLERLVPLAIDVYEAALKRHLATGEYDAAEKLLRGVLLLSSRRSDAPSDVAR